MDAYLTITEDGVIKFHQDEPRKLNDGSWGIPTSMELAETTLSEEQLAVLFPEVNLNPLKPTKVEIYGTTDF